MLGPAIRDSWYRGKYGFTDATIDEFLLGWSDGHLFEHFTRQLNVSRSEALATGLFVQRPNGEVKDFFVKRLIFPYWRNGRVVYFSGRQTELTERRPWEGPKYKKLPTHSRRRPYVSRLIANDTFYNEDSARRADILVITEGITDCISASQAGYACISPGTAQFRRKDHEKLLKSTGRVTRIVICNDAEDSGAGDRGAVETARILFNAGRNVRIATLPRAEGAEKLDLNEFVRTEGVEAFQEVVEKAEHLPLFLIGRIPGDTQKAELADAAGPALELLRTANPLLREACSDLLKARFRLKA